MYELYRLYTLYALYTINTLYYLTIETIYCIVNLAQMFPVLPAWVDRAPRCFAHQNAMTGSELVLQLLLPLQGVRQAKWGRFSVQSPSFSK